MPIPYGIIFLASRNNQRPSECSPSSARVLPLPLSRSPHGGGPVRATMIEMVRLAFDPWPLWWRRQDGAVPKSWRDQFESFTEGDSAEEQALAAAIFIARVRRRSGRGPTFAELFEHLLPDSHGVPGPFPERLNLAGRRWALAEFRRHVAIEWRRRGLVDWDHRVTRSLRVGRAFRQLSRERQETRTVSERTSGDSLRVSRAVRSREGVAGA